MKSTDYPLKSFDFSLHLNKILQRENSLNSKNILVVGTESDFVVADLVTQKLNQKFLTQIVILPDHQRCVNLERLIVSINSSALVLIGPQIDFDPFDGNPPILKEHQSLIYFLDSLTNCKGNEIVILPANLCNLRLPTFKNFNSKSFLIKKADKVSDSFFELLNQYGYTSSSTTEEVGSYSVRGNIIDVFTPSSLNPIRIELFGDEIQSLRLFHAETQLSLKEIDDFKIIPSRFFCFEDVDLDLIQNKLNLKEQVGSSWTLHLSRKDFLPEFEYFYWMLNDLTGCILDYVGGDKEFILSSLNEIENQVDLFLQKKESFIGFLNYTIPRNKFFHDESFLYKIKNKSIYFQPIDITTNNQNDYNIISYKVLLLKEFRSNLSQATVGSKDWVEKIAKYFKLWIDGNYDVIFNFQTELNENKWSALLPLIEDKLGYSWSAKRTSFSLTESLKFEEDKLILISDADLFHKKNSSKNAKNHSAFIENASVLAFGDLKTNDFVVHNQHGIGIFEGLTLLEVGGIKSEFLQIQYKDKDKLYLPIYRVSQLQKYLGGGQYTALDRLGGVTWEKAKQKVKNQMYDLAHDLLSLYAERASLKRTPINFEFSQLETFANSFPYEETKDQLKSFNEILQDLRDEKPMDRLLCGDVGFGKTEVAMRSSFLFASSGKQVAILAPTTVLCFQHFDTFKKRFVNFPNIKIAVLNRFTTSADTKKIISELKDGSVHILIGTHRILSKDIEFKNLGFLVIDEEQRFGVLHKEKIRKFKSLIDTLSMSATPLPRTLNLSLSGVRDISLLSIPPENRLPIKTYISSFDDDLVKKAILQEIKRGGRVYFIHNRVQSIHALADKLKELLPTIRLAVGHGQMTSQELEDTMLKFYSGEVDVLLATTIVESGLDVSSANTMFIDDAHKMGLSQLYQLRGRVGRSHEKAYCYLLIPKDKKIDRDAMERVKIIQDNTSLGSGIKIAQYDLELRGSGNVLGEEQSGHIESVGIETFYDLLQQTIAEISGKTYIKEEIIEPEINLRVPAFIPENYIKDIRTRLIYYKRLSDMKDSSVIDEIENEMKDQFGALPSEVHNLFGLMLVRLECRSLGIKDVSIGLKNLSLTFSSNTKVNIKKIIVLTTKENKKYSITPGSRLNVKMNNQEWPRVLEEIILLKKLVL